MIQNYLLTALRNLRKNKHHAALNLAGLGIGLACCLLIALYISNELSYDRYHANADRIWRVTRTFHEQDGSVNLHLSAIAPPFHVRALTLTIWRPILLPSEITTPFRVKRRGRKSSWVAGYTRCVIQ